MWDIYTMGYHSAVKNNIMEFAGKWMEAEKIILSEVTQIQKDKHGMYPLIKIYLLLNKGNHAIVHRCREAK